LLPRGLTCLAVKSFNYELFQTCVIGTKKDLKIPGGEIVLLRWRQGVIDVKIWNVYHKTEQGGGLWSVAYAPPRCNRHKQVSKQWENQKT